MFGRRMALEAVSRQTSGYQAPAPSGVFSQFSERALTRAILVGGVGLMLSVGQLIFDTERLWWSVASGGAWAAVAIGAGLERRRR